jgi:hypothetical protein
VRHDRVIRKMLRGGQTVPASERVEAEAWLDKAMDTLRLYAEDHVPYDGGRKARLVLDAALIHYGGSE